MSKIKMPPLRVKQTEQMIAKFKFKKSITSAKQKIYYIGERSHDGYAHPNEKYFDAYADEADRYKLIHYIEKSKIAKNPNLASYYDLTFSITKEVYENPDQYKNALRSTMTMMEREKGVRLHWIGAVHDPINEKGTQPHVHVVVATEAEYRVDNHQHKAWKKTGYVKFSIEDIAKMTNHMKKEMGMDFVEPEKALENEKRIQGDWKMQTLERKVAFEFGLVEQRIQRQRAQAIKHPLDVVKKLVSQDQTPQNRNTATKNNKEQDGGLSL